MTKRKWTAASGGLTPEQIRKMLEERLKEQTERHDGGKYWVGTGGTSAFGHSGYAPQGIRVGGTGATPFRVADGGRAKLSGFP